MKNNEINLNNWVSRSVDQVSSELDGEAVILNIKSGKYFNLKLVGKRIWELLQNPTKIDILVQVILSEYDVDLDKCREDIHNLITNPQEAGLVIVSEDQPGNGQTEQA